MHNKRVHIFAPTKPPVHRYAFTLNGEKCDTALTFEQAIGLAQCSKYHRRDHRIHKDADIYAVATWPELEIRQVLDPARCVYALANQWYGHTNNNEVWTKGQLVDMIEKDRNQPTERQRLTVYQLGVIQDYANNL